MAGTTEDRERGADRAERTGSSVAPWTSAAAASPEDEVTRLRAVLGHCPRCIAVLDERGVLAGYNRVFAGLFDAPLVLGVPLADLFEGPDRELLGQVVHSLRDEDRSGALLTLRTSRGRDVEFLAATLPWHGGLVGVVLAGDDRTDRLAEEVDRATLAESVDARNAMAAFDLAHAVLTHDLANSVAVAVLAVQAMQSMTAVDARAQLSSEALEALKHASDLVHEARTRARPAPRAPGIEKVEEVADVRLCVTRVERFLRHSASRRHAQLSSTFEGGLVVAMSTTELTQVVTNLLSNSIHAIEEAKRPGRVTLSAVEEEGNVRIHVRDTGVGIEPSRLASVFEPYETTRAAQGGSGLGLAIVKHLVEAAGGRIRAVSTPGEGTEIVVELPSAGTLASQVRLVAENETSPPSDASDAPDPESKR
jgi:two-component system cell cycle sensor histidine kinase/response regulator CckA